MGLLTHKLTSGYITEKKFCPFPGQPLTPKVPQRGMGPHERSLKGLILWIPFLYRQPWLLCIHDYNSRIIPRKWSLIACSPSFSSYNLSTSGAMTLSGPREKLLKILYFLSLGIMMYSFLFYWSLSYLILVSG